ncbi:response regulator [bacterium]|nr:response regulator [bacterium]
MKAQNHINQSLILIVEDDPHFADILTDTLQTLNHTVIKASNGVEALDIIQHEVPDLIITDINMPHLDGYGLCTKIKTNRSTRLIPVIMMTGMDDLDSRVKGIEVGADDFITKPFQLLELRARVASLIKLKHYTDHLENAEEVIFSLAMAVEAKDPYTNGHCRRIATIGSEVARHMGCSDDDVQSVYRGGFLHDIGKIGVPDAILNKTSFLDDSERDLVVKHPTTGEDICKPLHTLTNALPIIRHHHERIDGKGYPDGLSGDEIPLNARIVAVVDCFDAMTTDRPYRKGMSYEKAELRLLKAVDSGQLDENAVNATLQITKLIKTNA